MFESVGAKVRFRFRLNYLYCHSFTCLTVDTPHSSSLWLYCRELATLHSSWVNTPLLCDCSAATLTFFMLFTLLMLFLMILLTPPHAPPHASSCSSCSCSCSSLSSSHF